MKRVQMPERAYKKFFFCNSSNLFISTIVKQKPFSYGASHGREFGIPDEKMLSEHYREVLQVQKNKYIDYVERPSKYEPEPTEPLCMQHMSKYYKHDPINKPFGYSTHTSWEQFQHTIRSEPYQTVLSSGKGFQFKHATTKYNDRKSSVPPSTKNTLQL